eukprot:gene24217-27396_t
MQHLGRDVSWLGHISRRAGLDLHSSCGLGYNPLTRRYALNNNTQAVLFDLDGTLIDSAPDLGAAADKMRVDRGLPSLAAALYRPMAGAGARGMLQIAFGMSPQDPAFDAMREEFFVNYEQGMTENTYAFEGVSTLLRALEQGQLPWGVVTNKSQRFTLPLTRSMPLFANAASVVS